MSTIDRSARARRRRHRLLAGTLAAATALGTAVVASGGASAEGVPQPPGKTAGFTLTILHNNDGESDVLPRSVEVDEGVFDEFGGVANFATVVRREKRGASAKNWGHSKNFDNRAQEGKPQRRTKHGVIMVSSGDNFLASPEFDASVNDGVYYDAIALDLIRYDALAIGNHDLDFGPDVLEEFIETFRPRRKQVYVSANLDFSQEPGLQQLVDRGKIAKSTIVRERGERIGIVGATTPNLPFISSPRDIIVDQDVAAAVQAEIDMLEAKGVNKIVFISHLQDVEGDVALISMLDGVDVAVAGGGDELLANADDVLIPGDEGNIFGPYPIIATDADGTEVPVVTTSGAYGYLGKLVVEFDKYGNVTEIVDEESGPIRIAGGDNPDAVKPNRRIQRQVVEPVAAHVATLAEQVIGSSEVDLDGRRAPGVRTDETNEGNLIADSQLWQAQQLAAGFGVPAPDVALQNGGGIRNNDVIPAGPISELDTFDMVPFPNFVTVVPDISRAQFKEILENAVSRTQPGDTPGGTGRFAQVAGFEFTYSGGGTAQVLNPDGTVATPGTRIQEVTFDDGTAIVSGGAVVAGPAVSIAIVDFLARGGDEYPFRGAPFTAIGVSYQQALSNYIQGPLAGNISAADYPEGGEGRITALP